MNQPSPRTLAQQRRRLANRARFAAATQVREMRDLRAIACREMQLVYGPVLVSAACLAEADSADTQGRPTAWLILDNREAVVPAIARA